MASYGSSKAAVNHLTRNIAFDLGPKTYGKPSIAPGAIRTRALASVLTLQIEAVMLARTPFSAVLASRATSPMRRCFLFAGCRLDQRAGPDGER